MKYLVAVLGIFLLSGCVNNVQNEQITAAQLNVKLGDIYLQEGQLAVAKTKYLKALELDPALPEARAGWARYQAVESKRAFR